ncbi:ABC transporter permease [Clostridium sp. AM58-1XD]|uniref:ABC transporter permease n=1 Tax=Clostridium sp. AM58-1XD TaxID=2292307 RepID=UPI000E4B709D|nr:ABC transporter permease [Clostridium sp. AM58-1XD]RGZ00361.1 ABC transporter permease [Clostridium sp. AM58-1XD]
MKKFLSDYIKKDGNRNVILLLLYLIVQTLVFSALLPHFMTVSNAQNLMRQTAELGMVSIPLSIVLMTGNIDLSIGAVMGVCAISMARMLKMGMAIPLALVITVGIGALVGSLNGFCVAKMHLDGLVATIGTQVMLRGFCYILTGGRSVSGLPQSFTRVSKMYILGIPISFIIMMIIFAAAIFIMQKTGFGIKVHAIGYNAKASEFSGIKADGIKFWLFVLSGCVAAVASLFMLMRFASAESEFANGYDMDTLTAILLGGISIAGGSGNMLGAFLGLVTVATLKNGLNHMGMTATYQQFIIGLLIVISAIQWKKKRD